MEIFNIHIFEFLLIAGLALIVFGPERLPEVGRFIGQQLARFLAWQQNSPELQLLNEVRSDFEREIAELRDELVRTRQQLDISPQVTSIKDELRPMLDLKGNLTLPPADSANGATPANLTPDPSIAAPDPAAAPTTTTPDTLDSLAPDTADALEALAPDAPPTVRPAAQTVAAAAQPNRLALAQPTDVLGTPGPSAGDQPLADPPPEAAIDERLEYLRSHRSRLHEAPEPDPAFDTPIAAQAQALGSPALSEAEHAELLQRLQALAGELQALAGELRERGVIGADWQLPAEPPAQETITR